MWMCFTLYFHISVFTYQRALARVDAVRSVRCGRQSPVVFVPAVDGRRHAEFVLTVELQARAHEHRARHLAGRDMWRH